MKIFDVTKANHQPGAFPGTKRVNDVIRPDAISLGGWNSVELGERT